MGLPGELKRRIQMLFHREQFRRDLEEEMRLHLDLRRQQQLDRGLSPVEAARAAHLKFGNTTRIKERSLMAWGSETLESFFSDIVYGARALFRSPALTVVALLSLALGIGANTAIFSLLDAVLLRSLPVKDPQQLVLLGRGNSSGIGDNFVSTELYSYPFYRQLQQKNAVFSGVAAIFSMTDDVHGFVLNNEGESNTDSQLMHVNLVSGTYFPMLGVRAQLGRTLNEADDSSEGDHPVVVLSHGFWKRSLASDPNVLNRKIKLGTTIFTIVGVAHREFFGTSVGESPDMWVPMSMTKSVPPGWDAYNKNFVQSMNVIGRLKPDVSLAQATTNVNLLLQQITRGFSDAVLSQKNLNKLSKTHVPLTPMANGLSSIRQEFSEPLQILMAVVALVLLIACANIANLLLARSTARARELAVRQALGARRSRLIRQLLTESLVLALAGGMLGIGFAVVANRFLLRMVSDGFETLPLDIGLNLRLLGFTFAVTVTTAILFGTIPAFRATRLHLTDSLKDGRGPGGARAKNPLAKVLVVSQVALSLVLMVGAGLFLRSLVNLNHIDPGFNRENVLRLQVETDVTGYKEDDPRLNALFQQIESRVSALPGVKAASFSSFTFHEGSWSDAIFVSGMPNNENIEVHQNVVGNGYFDTMQIPLIAGRTFSTADTATSQRVAVISEHIAKTLFPPGNPVGHHFGLGDNKPEHDFEVIGIVKDAKFDSLQENSENVNYLSYLQRPWNFGDFEVRYSGDFSNISASVQQAIKSINHNVRISHVTTLDDQVARTVTNQRLVAQLSTFFGLLAVFLSAIGIYGLMSYVVSRRTNEIGIRMALGAARSNVSWLVLREILLLVAIGIAIGIPVALAADRLVANMLVGFKGADPVSLTAAVVLLLLVTSAAGYFPAKRASMVDPMEALRYE
ncbi:ABC transporter permease [Acidobacterium sp. S8]|uniref:ABC transporter permease n=1 Tax=Acidobacterium sp. S8 TaxID=1641854 RepID=UPI00131E9253|nr:ABC transporter permease [Acidobacterium sp. S8]